MPRCSLLVSLCKNYYFWAAKPIFIRMKQVIVALLLTLFLADAGSLYSQEVIEKRLSRKERKAKAKATKETPAVQPTQQAKPIESPEPPKAVEPGKGREVIAERPVITLENLEKKTQPVVEQRSNGSINWTEQFIEAKGQSVIDNERFKNPAQAKLMAIRGAVVVAQRNLLEITQGVSVTSETKVKDMIAESDYIYTRVDGVIKNAQQVGEAVEKDGYMEVTMRIPIYSAEGLAPVLYDQLATKRRGTETQTTEEPSAQYLSSEIQLTEELGGSEGFIFNFNGKKIDPSMFPVVMDEKGNLLFDFYKLYDPKTGKFPKIIQQSKEAFELMGVDKKNLKILDVAESFDGKIILNEVNAKKINWQKIGKFAAKAGKILTFALALI